MLGFAALCELSLCELPGKFTPSTSDYGGVWVYGLKHWLRLRGELTEEQDYQIAPETMLAVGRVVERVPEPTEDDASAKILLRLEAERARRKWTDDYLSVLQAYREGVRDYFDDVREQDRRQRKAREDEKAEKVRQAKRRRHVLLLLLDS